MKAEIVANFEGITLAELQKALQGLRDVEQADPQRIQLFILATAPEMKVEGLIDVLKAVKPPLTYMRVISQSSALGANRPVQEERRKAS